MPYQVYYYTAISAYFNKLCLLLPFQIIILIVSAHITLLSMKFNSVSEQTFMLFIFQVTIANLTQKYTFGIKMANTN